MCPFVILWLQLLEEICNGSARINLISSLASYCVANFKLRKHESEIVRTKIDCILHDVSDCSFFRRFSQRVTSTPVGAARKKANIAASMIPPAVRMPIHMKA
jgi:hypothetical protein